MSRIIYNTSIIAIASVISSILGFLSNIFLVNKIDPTILGQIFLVSGLAFLIERVFAITTWQSIIKNGLKKSGFQILSLSIKVDIFIATTSSIVLFICLNLYPIHINGQNIGDYEILPLVVLLLFSTNGFFIGILTSQKKFNILSIAALSGSLARFLAIIFFIKLKLSPQTILYAYSLEYIINSSILIIFGFRILKDKNISLIKMVFSFEMDYDFVKKNLLEAFFFTSLGNIKSIGKELSAQIIGFVLGPSYVVYYNTMMGINIFGIRFGESLRKVLYSDILNLDFHSAVKYRKDLYLYFIPLFILIILIISTVHYKYGKDVMVYFYGEVGWTIFEINKFFLPVYLISYFLVISEPFLVYFNGAYSSFIVQCVANLVQIFVLLILIHSMGISALCFSYFISFAAQIILINRSVYLAIKYRRKESKPNP